MKSLDPKPSKVSVPAIIRPRPINMPGIRGTLPLKSGEVILTPQEEKRLLAVGWKPGQAIPGHIGELIQQTNQELQHQLTHTQLKPSNFKPKIGPEVDISTLTPEKRGELEGYLADYQKQVPAIERAMAVRDTQDQLTPAVQKVLAEAGGVEVFDSRQDPLSNQEVSAKGFQRRIDEAEGKGPATEDSGLAEDDEEPGLMAIGDCPHCGKDLTTKPDDVPAEDKMNFLTSFMGGTAFRKSYSLLGGRLEFVFRELQSDQTERVLHQLPKLVSNGDIEPNDALRMGHLFRGLQALDLIKRNGEETKVGEAVDEQMGTDDNLLTMYQYIRDSEMFTNDSMWQMFRDCYEQFDDLVNMLRAKATDKDFWDAIGG